MMKLPLLLLLLSTEAFAGPLELNCEASYNLEKVLQSKVTLEENEKNKAFGDFNQFTFYISSQGKDVLELQVLNHNEPSRTYATSVVNAEHNFVDLSIWNRDFLLDVRCSL